MLETSSNQTNSCEICGLVLGTLNGLKTHVKRKHNTTLAILNAQTTGIELPKCMLCEMRSTQLARHILVAHGLNVEDYRRQFHEACVSMLTPSQQEKVNAVRRSKPSKHKESLLLKEQNREQTLNAGLENLRCQLCDVTSANSLISHITRKHKVSMAEYRIRFPGYKVQQASPAQRLNNSRVMKEKLSDPLERAAFLQWRSFPSEIKHWIRKGLSPREAEAKVAEFQRTQSLKGNNETTRAKRSAKYSGENNPMSIASISTRNSVSRDEAKKLTPCFGRTGESHPMYGKKHSEESIRKIGQHLNHSGKSKVEHEMSDCIISCYGGEKNAHVAGWCCDYVHYERRIVVEFFGDYWHHNPTKYSPEYVNGLTKRNSVQVWTHDAKKISSLHQAGYEVIVVWESEWRADKDSCMKRINDAFNRIL